MTGANETNGRFKYENTYMCKNEAGSTTPEYRETSTETSTEMSSNRITELSTTATNPPSTESITETTARFETTATKTSTTMQSETTSTYSESPSTTTTSPIRFTTTNGTTDMTSQSFGTTNTTKTTNSASTTTTLPEISTLSGTSMEVTDTSTITNASTIDTSIDTPSIFTSTVSYPSTLVPTSSTSSTVGTTTFSSTVVTEETNTNATEVTIEVTDADAKNCSKLIEITNFNYVVRHAMTNVACVLINMKMWINLQYATEDSQTDKATLTVPAKARTTGKCDEKMAEMILSWDETAGTRADSDDKENRIVFHYAHNNATFFLDSVFVDVHLDSKNFPGARQERISGGMDLQLFYAPIKDGIFICTADIVINVENQITAVISDMYLIAFNNCSKHDCWKTENNCIFKLDVNVSAIVGAVIVGILLILIIFYLMWSKRKNNFANNSKNFTDYSHKIVLQKFNKISYDKYYRKY